MFRCICNRPPAETCLKVLHANGLHSWSSPPPTEQYPTRCNREREFYMPNFSTVQLTEISFPLHHFQLLSLANVLSANPSQGATLNLYSSGYVDSLISKAASTKGSVRKQCQSFSNNILFYSVVATTQNWPLKYIYASSCTALDILSIVRLCISRQLLARKVLCKDTQ